LQCFVLETNSFAVVVTEPPLLVKPFKSLVVKSKFPVVKLV
jgi:hypothetical protein